MLTDYDFHYYLPHFHCFMMRVISMLLMPIDCRLLLRLALLRAACYLIRHMPAIHVTCHVFARYCC